MDNKYLEKELNKFDNKTSIEQLQKYINEMIEIRGFEDETLRDLMLLLTEEVGELAKEIRKKEEMKIDINKNNNIDLKGEIADVFIYILSICRAANINLMEAFKEKEEKNCKRQWR